jgi:hypothetical protein
MPSALRAAPLPAERVVAGAVEGAAGEAGLRGPGAGPLAAVGAKARPLDSAEKLVRGDA